MHNLFTTRQNECRKFYPYGILLCAQNKYLGVRFQGNNSKNIFLDIPISELQALFNTDKENPVEILKEAHEQYHKVKRFYPLGIHTCMCEIDVNIVENLHVLYLNEDFSLRVNKYVSLKYPCCTVRFDNCGSRMAAGLYVINHYIYDTDFIDRFKIGSNVEITGITSELGAICETFYLDEYTDNLKARDCFEEDLREFRRKYATPSWLNFELTTKEGRDVIKIKPLSSTNFLANVLTVNTSELKLQVDSTIKRKNGLDIAIDSSSDPILYVLSKTSSIIEAQTKRTPSKHDFDVKDSLIGEGRLSYNYIMTGFNEFLVLPMLRINPVNYVTKELVNNVRKVFFDDGKTDSVIIDMACGDIETKTYIAIDNKVKHCLEVKVPVDFNAFGEENAEEAYKVIRQEFKNLANMFNCEGSVVSRKDNKFVFRFKTC